MYNFPKRTEVECLTLKALKDEKMGIKTMRNLPIVTSQFFVEMGLETKSVYFQFCIIFSGNPLEIHQPNLNFCRVNKIYVFACF